MEKQLSGKAMEKFPDYKTVSVSMKRNGTKESTCGDCDVIINRWQQYTGKEAVLESTGETFNSKIKV